MSALCTRGMSTQSVATGLTTRYGDGRGPVGTDREPRRCQDSRGIECWKNRCASGSDVVRGMPHPRERGGMEDEEAKSVQDLAVGRGPALRLTRPVRECPNPEGSYVSRVDALSSCRFDWTATRNNRCNLMSDAGSRNSPFDVKLRGSLADAGDGKDTRGWASQPNAGKAGWLAENEELKNPGELVQLLSRGGA